MTTSDRTAECGEISELECNYIQLECNYIEVLLLRKLVIKI